MRFTWDLSHWHLTSFGSSCSSCTNFIKVTADPSWKVGYLQALWMYCFFFTLINIHGILLDLSWSSHCPGIEPLKYWKKVTNHFLFEEWKLAKSTCVLRIHYLSEQYRQVDFTPVNSEILIIGVEIRTLNHFIQLLKYLSATPLSFKFKQNPFCSKWKYHIKIFSDEHSPIIHYFASHVILVSLA